MRDVLRLIALLCALFSAPLALSAPVHAEPEREAQDLLEEFASERALSLSDVDVDELLATPSASDEPEPDERAANEPDDLKRAAQGLLSAVEKSARDGWAEIRSGAGSSFANLLNELWQRAPAPVRSAARDLQEGRFSRELQRSLVEGFALAVALLLVARIIRGSGNLAVNLDYPTELRGTFSVRVARSEAKASAQNRRAGRIATPEDARRAMQRIGTGSRSEHTAVARETLFRKLPARSCWVTIDGFLQAAEGDAVVWTVFEEREIRVRRNETERLDIDARPRSCRVDVHALWDRRPVADALVSLRGNPASLRFVRGGRQRLDLAPGTHTIVVGSGDRVAERTLDINSLQPIEAVIDLTGTENVLFTGCPPAVGPYLNGDIPAAARALERDGQVQTSHLLLAGFYRDRDQHDSAARHYEQAGRPLEAAELREHLSQFAESAPLYEQAGETARAADMYRSAGELIHAGEAYESIKRYASAVECYQKAGEITRVVEALEKQGVPFDAARFAIEHDDWARAIRSLQQVTGADPDYVEAANLLVDAYQREGHLDLAARKLEEIISTKGADRVPIEVCDGLATKLEEHADFDRALDMLEIVRRRDATYPNVATRIESLRKRRSKTQRNTGDENFGTGDSFSSEFRYEILEEVGRGGMGIVFKARDRRLGRVVALKRLPENLRNHPKAIELFLREARAAAALNHTNIVTVFDAGQEGDTYYITMELLEGLPLATVLKRNGRLSPRDVARLGIQITTGLQYAHDQRIIHRDIKTANLFVTNSRTVKIMDFGLAKMVEEVRRATTVIGGTPYYMAPEQSQGGGADHRADLYALGVTLFELATGKVPFVEGDVAYHHRHTPPPDPRDRAEGIPTALAELVLELLAKEPADRTPSAAIVGERLAEIARSVG